MESQNQEPAGDYGYDMAHEDIRRPKPPEPAPEPEHGRASAASRTPELDQDYSYDEAHGF